jgi:hypothetical protein
VLRTTPSRPAAADVLLAAHLASGDVQGVGLVYRFLDPDNFCFFVMNRDKGYRLLAKKVAGSFSQLATPALDAAQGFELDHVYRVRLVARGPDVQVFLDGRLALQGRDRSVVAPGRVGFMSFRNPQARFHDLELTEV